VCVCVCGVVCGVCVRYVGVMCVWCVCVCVYVCVCVWCVCFCVCVGCGMWCVFVCVCVVWYVGVVCLWCVCLCVVCVMWCVWVCVYTHLYIYARGRDNSVGIATHYGLDGPGSNPGRDEIFLNCPDRPGARRAFYTKDCGSFPGEKKLGRGVDQLPPSSALFNESVGIYFYSSSGLPWPVRG